MKLTVHVKTIQKLPVSDSLAASNNSAFAMYCLLSLQIVHALSVFDRHGFLDMNVVQDYFYAHSLNSN